MKKPTKNTGANSSASNSGSAGQERMFAKKMDLVQSAVSLGGTVTGLLTEKERTRQKSREMATRDYEAYEETRRKALDTAVALDSHNVRRKELDQHHEREMKKLDLVEKQIDAIASDSSASPLNAYELRDQLLMPVPEPGKRR